MFYVDERSGEMEMGSKAGPVKLKCAYQTYKWGKIGARSAVAQFAQSDPSFHLQQNEPYAELWMGTHPNGPSQVFNPNSSEQQSLLEWIDSHDGCLGSKVSGMFEGKLPFLFKVLSVNKALSIQAHPNKEHAEKLHAARPDVYKDPNHKPEMAIALTEYEGLCGFRPISEIKEHLKNVPEFAAIIGDAASSIIQCSDDIQAKVGLQRCFTALMTSPADVVKKHLDNLVAKIKTMKEKGQDSSKCLGDLVTRLNSQFPGDVGCFCAYFLNHVVLQPGEAMFLGPNLPHAYLSGDCMECMACSDNVVRAGLTPKYKDVETLCEMLDYKPSTASENIFQPHKHPSDPCVTIYDPPVKDFSVMKIQVPLSTIVSSYRMKPLNGPSILIVISGSATLNSSGNTIGLGRGNVIFIPASSDVSLEFEKEEPLAACWNPAEFGGQNNSFLDLSDWDSFVLPSKFSCILTCHKGSIVDFLPVPEMRIQLLNSNSVYWGLVNWVGKLFVYYPPGRGN